MSEFLALNGAIARLSDRFQREVAVPGRHASLIVPSTSFVVFSHLGFWIPSILQLVCIFSFDIHLTCPGLVMQSSSRAIGLPSGPGRARSRTRNEPDRPHDRAPSLPRQVRPQKSAPSIRRERSIAPPIPRQHTHNPSYHRSADTESYRSSHDSASSVSSRSLFDHARSGSGYASSVTSYEDDDYGRRSSKSQSLRTRRAQQSTATDSYGQFLSFFFGSLSLSQI